MGAILAIAGDVADQSLPARLEAMLARSPYRGAARRHLEPGLAVAVQQVGSDASIAQRAELVVAFHGYVGNWLAIGGATGEDLAALSPAERFLVAHERLGNTLLPALRGEFAVLEYDRRARTLTLVRDAIGGRPLFEATDGERVAVASEPRQVLAGLGLTARPDDDALALLLAGASDEPDGSVLAGVRRVVPGDVVTIGPGQRRAAVPYWRPPEQLEGPSADEGALADELRARLEGAVERALPGELFAVALSGGLDSTTVWALALLLAGDDVKPIAVSLGLPGFACDETPFVRAALAYTGGEGTLIAAEAHSVLDHLLDAAAALDEPAVPTIGNLLPLLEAATARGCRVVLTGLGGDEWLTGCYFHPAEALRRGRVVTAVGDALRLWIDPGASRLRFLLRALAFPRGLRRRPPRVPEWVHPERRERVASALRRERDLDLSTGVCRSALLRTLRRRRAADPLDPLEQLAACHRVELRHPLMDLDLVEFAFQAPPRALTGGRVFKHLLRRAAGELLPALIRERRDLPSLEHVLASDRDRVLEYLRIPGCRVVARRIVDPAWLDKELARSYTISAERFSQLADVMAVESFLRTIERTV